MARRSSGGRSARPTPRRAPAPAPVRQAPPPAPVQSGSGGSMLGGIGSTIAQGMAFGGGSAVAHRAVDAVMGPRTIHHETAAAEASTAPTSMTNSDACSIHSKAFQDVYITSLSLLSFLGSNECHDIVFALYLVACIFASHFFLFFSFSSLHALHVLSFLFFHIIGSSLETGYFSSCLLIVASLISAVLLVDIRMRSGGLYNF